jgi:putative ABC transport system substrate-binding protein
MDRRAFIALVGGSVVITVGAATGQQTDVVRRVGIVSDPPYAPNALLDAFRKALRELGYVEGENILSVIREWDGTSEDQGKTCSR